jgi:outer membrane receptor protein involved in Fe transport
MQIPARFGRKTNRSTAKTLKLHAGMVACGLVVAASPALAAEAAAVDTPAKGGGEVSEVVVNGVPYRETVLPTRLTNSSTYGIDMNVMETPRSTTLLSTTQLETLNINDARAFSYLTSSSYTDSAFGTPNIPRVRTQYADVFYNGMRNSLTQNGYGVPINYEAFANINITKGPASVVYGPGPDVGGEVDFLTKRPNLNRATGQVSATFDTVNNRRWTVDASMPLIKGDLAVLLSYSGEDSGGYFYGHWMRKNALYGALRWVPNDKYSLDFNTEVNSEQYTEEVGVNRVNQALIDSGTYLTGQPADPEGFLTFFPLTGSTKLNPRITIDQTPGTVTRAWLYNAQLIQSYRFNDHLTLENNTLFMFQNSENLEAYYYADNSNGSYTIENKTDLKGEFHLSFNKIDVLNQFIVGASYRFAHTNYISNFNAEAVSVWDLSGNPNSWRLSPDMQSVEDAMPYKTVFGHTAYGVLGRDFVSNGNSGVSDLIDGGLFFQDRMEFSPQFSVLFGARIDALQDKTHDPLTCTSFNFTCADFLPRDHSSGVYGLGNANISAVYKFTPGWSGYVTLDWTQSPPNPNGGEGGINLYGFAPDSLLLRSSSYLYEAGMKFNLLNNKLFLSSAIFDQKHQVPAGAGSTTSLDADTYGIELEGNYQPNRNLYATASYSYVRSVLASPPTFYNFPAQLGLNVDGAPALLGSAMFVPGQKVDQPGQPQHLFNALANYKFSGGFGVRSGIQVTGPIHTTASAQVYTAPIIGLIGALPNSVTPVGSGVGFYKGPVIPWQYTWNMAVFYEWKNYVATLSVYNLTDRTNWSPAPSFYGNDFLVRSDPRTVEIRLQAKF